MLSNEIRETNEIGIEAKAATYDRTTHMSEMHYHSSYEILHVTENSRILTAGNNSYRLDKSNVALIPPFIPHMTSSGEKLPEKRILVAFHEYSVHDIKKQLGTDLLCCFASPCNIIQIGAFEDEFNFLLKKLLSSQKEHPSKLDECSSQLALCSLLALLSQNSQKQPLPGSFSEIIRYVEENFDQKITLDLLASKFFMSKFTVSRYFSKFTGSSLPCYVNTIRIIKAKKYLKENRSVTETAMLCGFDTTTAFDRVFLGYTGNSPSQYKKLLKLK